MDSLLRLAMLVFMGISAGVFITYLGARPLARALNLDYEFVAQVMGFLSMQGMALIWISMFVAEHDLTWAEAFGWRRAPGRSAAFGGLAMVLAVPFVWLVIGGGVALLYKLFGLTPEAQITVAFIKRHPPGWQLAVMAFTAVVLAPLAEETLFRGVLYPALKQRGRPLLAMVVTSALFAAIHFNVAAALPLFFLGLVWTWLYERTGNLLAPITAHVVFNAVNFLALVLDLPGWLEKFTTP